MYIAYKPKHLRRSFMVVENDLVRFGVKVTGEGVEELRDAAILTAAD